MRGETILEVDDVRFSYGGAKILRGLSLTLDKGDVICVIGANGAGKTTTLRTISGLEKPDSGQITFQGQRVNGLFPRNILTLGIAMVPEQGRLFPDMTVYENLVIGAYLRTDKQAINLDLDMVYGYFPVLSKRSRQRAGSLSGGERQMLAIGRALMSKPIVLMMDEPCSGLAPQFVAMLGKIILDLNREDLSLILVEQNADMALNIARYGYVLERGRVALEGETKDLINDEMVKKAYLGL